MKQTMLSLLAGLLLTAAGPLQAQSFSADDFLPPALADDPAQKAQLLAVQNPGEVEVETGTVSGEPAVKAANPQDAINAFIEQRTPGFTELVFPSGFGFAATGAAAYRVHQSNTATRIEQRNAYAAAYLNAKKSLAQGLFGIANEGKSKISESLSNIDTSDRTLSRYESDSSESINQAVEGLLRGYVVYDVHDDFAAHTVYVTIVTTPKTLGFFERPDPETVVADSVRDGLNQALVEVKNGLVPPVGGRTIFVPATGEMAYVGFGSAVVRQDSDPSMQTRQNLNAEKIAKMRASDALCGLILGDRITASDTLDSQTASLSSDFERLSEDDPISGQADSPNFQALSQRRQEFLSVESNSSQVASLRKGVLPPGVSTQGWRDNDNAFAYAVSVYLPSATERARAGADMMNRSQNLDGQGQTAQPGAAPPADPDVKPGPSGRIDADGAL
jgi:hypothetical protein